ncbi:MAG: hypothetical protein GTN78_00640 [Gemmatimonadales bacterium]|nr:hypothetical protein [Gemmatimonadales bacterium]NIN10046.1 hypothetical protein [Gemmatimonadales bacterium]NIQ98699.1 hypothetical protein [Gemmatimonadales bacterium]NIS63575.1 hypothetical protein [Gemmatimonadales bacterium]
MKDPATGKWGFIDTTGTYVISPRFVDPGTGEHRYMSSLGLKFVNGRAIVGVEGNQLMRDRGVAFVDRSGALAVRPYGAYLTSVSPFHDYRALICRSPHEQVRLADPETGRVARMRAACRYGYIDRSGNTVLSPRFAAAESSSMGWHAWSRMV